MGKIKTIHAREILDSRGNPTIEAVVTLEDGVTALACVPSGASKGTHEALELRDGGDRFHGMGVQKSVDIIHKTIAPLLRGKEAGDQRDIDTCMMEADGTADKSRLGANSILAVSLAVARAQAIAEHLPLWKYLRKLSGKTGTPAIGTPLFNVVNGGLHGSGNLSIQEFFIIPAGLATIAEKIRCGTEIYHALKKTLAAKHLSIAVGDEGGFTPEIHSDEEVLALLQTVVEESSYQYGKDVFLGVDVAASVFFDNGSYRLFSATYPTHDWIAYIAKLQQTYNLLCLEDALAEDEWPAWVALTKEMNGRNTHVVGDDLLVTNMKRLQKAVEEKACNSILVKVNQIGTLIETLDTVAFAKTHEFSIVLSHRSGETTDDFIADLAVAVDADFVKFGAPARGERVVKYNRLLAISEEVAAQ